MQLQPHEVHVWPIPLSAWATTAEKHLACLDDHDMARANRLHQPIHRQRFLTAHVGLRYILSQYLPLGPKQLTFTYGTHQKPYLAISENRIQFNLSHSDEMAVCAVTLDHEIGIDIEKVQPVCKLDVARRFFNKEEFDQLISTSVPEQANFFYRIWARKEALIKATGLGVSQGLATFSVMEQNNITTVELHNQIWSLLSLSVHADYACAVACSQAIHHLHYHALSSIQL